MGEKLSWRDGVVGVTMCLLARVVVPANASTEKVVYSFKGGSDGANPQAALLDVNGVLYGTTAAGGSTSCSSGCGTVFKVTATGKEKVLHSFQGGSDGFDPTAALIDVKGALYGTTSAGATEGVVNCSSCGTVFSITASGTEKVLHVFAGGGDGSGPHASLLNFKGTLYGTTEAGGGNCLLGMAPCGVVFSVTRSGTEKVLHVFSTSEGYNPHGGLVEVSGTLYGTTLLSGSAFDQGSCTMPDFDLSAGCGTVFSITPSGTERAVYTFQGGKDGGVSFVGPTEINGKMFGTTSEGGGSATCSDGCGTVFSVTPSGTEKVIYAFKGGSDGAVPLAGLIDVNGTLYGTTSIGGTRSCNDGCGTVFSVTKRGAEKVLYAFKGGSDGANPQAGLINVNGTLYGTTVNGGTSGLGTVFSITP